MMNKEKGSWLTQIVRAKETSSWAMVDSATDKHQAPTH